MAEQKRAFQLWNPCSNFGIIGQLLFWIVLFSWEIADIHNDIKIIMKKIDTNSLLEGFEKENIFECGSPKESSKPDLFK